jgi:hypothetical protein
MKLETPVAKSDEPGLLESSAVANPQTRFQRAQEMSNAQLLDVMRL